MNTKINLIINSIEIISFYFIITIVTFPIEEHTSALWLYTTHHRYPELAIYINDSFCIG